MWVFTSLGFISVVEDIHDESRLLVRARAEGTLERLFPRYKDEVFTDKQADYFYRLFIPRSKFLNFLIDELGNLHYTNFKNIIEDEDYHELCSTVWLEGFEYQERDKKQNGRTNDS